MAFEKSDNVKNSLREIINRINEDRRRIRLIEQNIGRLETGISSLEQASLTQMGDIKVALERLNNKLAEISNRLNALEAGINGLNKLVGKAATKVELKQLENFIDLVNPVTSKFVTKDELERAFEERMKRKPTI